MSTAVPLLGTAIADVLAAFQASPALAGVTVSGDVPTAAMDPEFVIAGHDGSLDPDGALSPVTEAGSFTVKFVSMGPGSAVPEQEDGAVYCVAVSQTGDSTDLAGRITEAQRLAVACAAAVTDLRTGAVLFGQVVSGRLFTRQLAQGCAAVVPFQVTYSGPWD